ncbi:hypothetical protein EMQ25_08900 [Arsenicitalea aurantiaca]|uniref:PepSY domain-containing protein n=1 Tax=Arsenicitalea aurantiaca TaxID=1783274 RepID=A0A433XAD5_9HYPH|nr:hypothetical protein [Arsenicitalea aurantiaca]RUT30988.1 hypothetical protein EMQ25_08900 [Arsenicitalea aurantiaca]
MKNALLALFAAGTLFSLAPAESVQAQACLSNQELQEAVSSGRVAPVADVLARAGVGRDQQVLSVRACDEGGRIVYVVGVLGADGNAQNLTLPAGF